MKHFLSSQIVNFQKEKSKQSTLKNFSNKYSNTTDLNKYFKCIVLVGLVLTICLGSGWKEAEAQTFLVTSSCSGSYPELISDYMCVDDLSTALYNALPGDMILVDDLTFNKDIIISNKATIEDPINILALPGSTPTIDEGYIYFSSNAENITLSGFEIKNKQNESGIRLSSSSVNITIKNCKIHDTGFNGILLKGEGHTVSNNIIYSTGLSDSEYKTHGIYVNANNSVIMNNIIFDSKSGNGIRTQGLSNHIMNNKVFNNHGYGVSVFADIPTENMVIANNVIHDNEIGIAVIGGSGGNIVHDVHIFENEIHDNRFNIVAIGDSSDIQIERNQIQNASYLQFYVYPNSGFHFIEVDNICAGDAGFLIEEMMYMEYEDFHAAVNKQF